jgi:hypothetical protein
MRLNVRFPLAVTLILLTASVFAGAQSTYNSSGVIFLTGSLYDSVGSSISVTNLPGTVTDISVTLNGLDITELNSVAMALVPPSGSGLKALDFFSGICGVGTQQIITNVFTVADTGAMGTDNVSGMIPYLGGTCPNALVGTYLPSDYFPGQDTFHSPGPSTYNSGGIGSTACASLNVNCGSYTFSTAFGLPASPTSSGWDVDAVYSQPGVWGVHPSWNAGIMVDHLHYGNCRSDHDIDQHQQ